MTSVLRGFTKRYLHPLSSTLFLVWAFYLIYSGKLLPVAIASLGLAVYLGVSRRVVFLLAWLGVSTFLILAVLFNIPSAVETTGRILLIALSAGTAIASPKPQHVAYVASRLGVKPLVGFSILFVLRLVQLLGESLEEAMCAARGRGIHGRWKTILLLPIPLLIHTIRISSQLAEALYIKYPGEKRTWIDKPLISIADIALLSYMCITLVIP